MNAIEDFFAVIGRNFSRNYTDSTRAISYNFSNAVSNSKLYDYYVAKLPTNTREIVKHADSNTNSIYCAEVVSLIARFFIEDLDFLFMGGSNFYNKIKSPIKFNSSPDDKNFMKKIRSEFQLHDNLFRDKEISRGTMHKQAAYFDIIKDRTIKIVSISEDPSIYNPVLVWHSPQPGRMNVFIPSKRVFNNIKSYLVDPDNCVKKIGILKPKKDGVCVLDMGKLSDANFDPKFSIVELHYSSNSYRDELAVQYNKEVDEVDENSDSQSSTEYRHKSVRDATGGIPTDSARFLTYDDIKDLMESGDNALFSEDKYGDLDPIELKIRGLKQEGPADCLKTATAIINHYLNNNGFHRKYILPPGGDPEMAHIVLASLGSEVAKGNRSYIKVNKDAAFDAFVYINNCLNRRLPVLVGLNYHKQSKYINNDKSTDHFALIYGRNYTDPEDDSIFYFMMWDVNGGKKVRLYVRKDNFIIDSYDSLKNKRYQLAQVRVSKKDSFREITGGTQMTAARLQKKSDTASA